jgi:hypothetical protein
MREDADKHCHSDVAVIAVAAYDLNHLVEIDTCEKEVAQPDADHQRQTEFEYIAQNRALFMYSLV